MGSRMQQQKTSKTHSSLSFKITLKSWDRDKKMDFHREARISLPEDLLEPKYFNILLWEQKRNPISLEHWRNVAHNSKREGKSITWKLIYLLSSIFCMFEPATIKKKNQLNLADYSFPCSASGHTWSSERRRSPDSTLELFPQMGPTLAPAFFSAPIHKIPARDSSSVLPERSFSKRTKPTI